MKKTFLLKTMLLLCALMVGGSAWADDITYTFTSKSWEAKVGETTANWTSGKDGAGFNNNGIQVTDNSSYTGANGTSPISYNDISEIVLTYNTNKSAGAGTAVVKIGNNTETSKSWGYSGSGDGRTANYTLTYSYATPQTGNVKITLNTTTNSIYLVSCKITYNSTISGTTAAPKISGNTLFLDNTTVTITNATSANGATIYYTTDGTTPTTSSTVYSAPFTINATTTVKDIAKKASDNNASSVVSETFTKATILTVAQARSAIDNSNTNDIDFVRGIIAKVVSLNDNGTLTYLISDDGSTSNSIQCYQGKNVGGEAFEAATDLEVGDIVIVKGQLEKSSNNYRFKANNEVVSMTARSKVNIATFTATTNPLILGETTSTTTTVTNNQSGWTPVSYSYESDNEDVATVNASGVITAVAKGTANITVTPVVSITDPAYKVGESKSLEITVSNPSHTATFSINGVISNESVEEGEAIPFPANPTTMGGKAFVGWTTSAIDGTTNTAPAFVQSATMSTANVAYFAVFANKSESTQVIDNYLTITNKDFTDALGGSYSTETITKTIGETSYSIELNACEQSSMCQMRDNATLSYIYVPTLPGKITNIATTECGNASGSSYSGTIHIKTSKTRGNSDTDDITKSDLSSATSFSINLTGNDKSFYLLTSAGLRIKDLTVTYKAEGTVVSYSAYCTTLPTTTTPAVTEFGWATYIAASDMEFAEGDAFIVTAANLTDGLTLEAATAVPQGTPLLLKGQGAKTAIVWATAPAALEDNLLTVSNGTFETGQYPYVLAKDGTSACFKQWTGDASVLNGRVVLILNQAVSTRSIYSLDEEMTGVQSVVREAINDNQYYNLSGQRVDNPTKGLYIVNGKKVIVK